MNRRTFHNFNIALLIAIVSFALLDALPAHSQSATPLILYASSGVPVTNYIASTPMSTTPQSIFSSAEQFFTDFGPESFTNEHGYFQTGAALQNNINVGATLELGCPIYHTSQTTSIDISSQTLNAGIAGTIVQEEIDASWGINVHDVKVSLGVGGGYDFDEHRAFPAVYAELQKKLTANTHIFLRAEEAWEGKVSAPLVVGGAGFTF